jgi:hypothetical protein
VLLPIKQIVDVKDPELVLGGSFAQPRHDFLRSAYRKLNVGHKSPVIHNSSPPASREYPVLIVAKAMFMRDSVGLPERDARVVS